MTEPAGRARLRKAAYSLLVIVFMLAVFRLGYMIVERSDQRLAQHAQPATEPAGTESITTYRFDNGTLAGRLSALGVGAPEGDARDGLRASFTGTLANRLDRAVKIRGMQAIARGDGRSLDEFRFTFKKAKVDAGQDYVFSGETPVSPEFFNRIIRRYDMALRIATDMGALELPFQAYTLEVEPALAAGLLKTNRVRFGEAEGIISFLNCEQVSAHEVCEPMLEQMTAAAP